MQKRDDVKAPTHRLQRSLQRLVSAEEVRALLRCGLSDAHCRPERNAVQIRPLLQIRDAIKAADYR